MATDHHDDDDDHTDPPDALTLRVKSLEGETPLEYGHVRRE